MSDDIAGRKALLVSRCAVERARLRYELVALRTPSSRLPLPLALVMALVKRRSGVGAIGKVAGILAIVRTVVSVVKLVRRH